MLDAHSHVRNHILNRQRPVDAVKTTTCILLKKEPVVLTASARCVFMYRYLCLSETALISSFKAAG